MLYFLKMKIDVKEIGTRIRQVRSTKDLTQEAFGRLLGVKGPAISKYEKGIQDPGAAGLAKIAELGNVSLDYLITGKGPGQVTPAADPLEVMIFSDPKRLEAIKDRIRDEVREELTPYNKKLPTDEEQQIISNYRLADPISQKHARRILEESAIESRRNAGGGSDLQAEKSA